MRTKPGSRKKFGSAHRSADTEDKDRLRYKDKLIDELKDRVAFLEDELKSNGGADGLTGAADRRTIEELRVSEERFRVVQENSLDRFTILKPFYNDRGEIVDFAYVYQNARAAETAGYRPEELVGRRMTEIFPTFPQTRFFAMYKLAVETGRVTEFEDHYHVDGVDDWFHATVTPIPDGIAVATQIITERRRAEETLLESEARFRSVLESSIDVVYRLNVLTGCFVYVSPSAETVMGYTPEEYMAMDSATALSMIHPDDLPGMHAAMEHLNKTGSAEAVYRQRAKNGEYRWMSNHMSLTRDGDGRPLYRNGNIRDITENKRAEETIREATRLTENRVRELKAVIDAMPDGLAIYNKDGNATYINEVSRRILASYNIEDVPPIEGRTEKAQVCKPDGTPMTLEDTPLYLALKNGERSRISS
ncbi:MAG TPA: PAS domain S-box protein [Methanocella sp.]|nr:PAS domain S-box protein [Methanocella sp.]